jgi:hypothetical protein
MPEQITTGGGSYEMITDSFCELVEPQFMPVIDRHLIVLLLRE